MLLQDKNYMDGNSKLQVGKRLLDGGKINGRTAEEKLQLSARQRSTQGREDERERQHRE